MNILPKKRWHVRNKDNVARVRRDEQQAKEEAEELELRNALAEKEAKLNLLRSKHSNDTSEKEVVQNSRNNGHINFFQELEDQVKAVSKSNADYEAEKKAEKESYEKKIGILTYLGQSASRDEVPWYLKNKHVKNKTDSTQLKDNSGERKKELMDPLQDVQKYLKKMKSSKDKERESAKTKKKSKYKEIINESKSSSVSIDELRAKRLKREREERMKAEQLITGKSTRTEEKDDRYDPDRYSSQYNPQFARKPREHRRYEPY